MMTPTVRIIIVVALFLSVAAHAQDISRSAIEPKITVGWATFIDESPIDHLVAGGAVRFYLSRRLGIEPEFRSIGFVF